ncbi:MAG TPA: CsbD family protein [Steroidobacteraceae bacterium]|nr:CsbD family protein [Steroidobacteraceae bacterium]
MTSDRVAGAWHQIKGKVKEQWGKLTDDDLKQLEGHAEQLAGKLQERYGLAREEAERQVKEFRKRMNWQ